ncbi:NUDIX hydrolase [Bifidobacterium porcinum]|uniref:NUDIX hydrolase n=1 Tax=Bifidobacterium TaxID=1678 RepID=UPI001EF9C97B|nr:NUDIX domain-containing protein [Bifidobacterium porcinum]
MATKETGDQPGKGAAMRMSANVSERAKEPPNIGVSVVILALGPSDLDGRTNDPSTTGTTSAVTDSLSAASTAETGNGVGRTTSRIPNGDTVPTLRIPLVRRIRQPFLGDWALPGGDLQGGRSLEYAAEKALRSTTSLHPQYLEQLYTFGNPSRSHGGLPMVSIVYWALIGETEAKDFREAQNVRWFPVNQLPPLAFDHKDIIEYALTRVRNKIEYSDIATRLVGSEFTLSQLRNVYEAIYGRKLDAPNFRRRMLSTGMVEPTGEKLARGAHRPACLYRYVAHAGTGKSATSAKPAKSGQPGHTGDTGTAHGTTATPR